LVRVSGGVVAGKTVATVWRFVSTRQHWVPASSMIQPRAHHSSAALGQRLYVLGGTRDVNEATGGPITQGVVETIECLEVLGGNEEAGTCFWWVVAVVPCPRLGSHAVAYGDHSLVEVAMVFSNLKKNLGNLANLRLK